MEIALLNVNYVYGFIFVLHRMAYKTGNNSKKNNIFNENCSCVPHGLMWFCLSVTLCFQFCIFQIRMLMFLSSIKVKPLRSFIQL